MSQLHTHFTTEQVKMLLSAYEAGHLSRTEIETTLGIGKTRFFALLKQHRQAPDNFSIAYQRHTPPRLSPEAEERIRIELAREKALVEDPQLPISGYNYAALTDRLEKVGIKVSPTTVVKRAIQQGAYQPKKKRKGRHDRQVLTAAAGDLVQHDASLHKWSPYADQKWSLITSLDDYSRLLLYADFVESETSWAHIQAVQSAMEQFGCPNRYYVDNLRVFRFVQSRDSVWKNLVLGTDEVITQWGQVLALMKTAVVYALSPQAKGKIERPYRWLQDRVVRTCALEHVTSLADARTVLREEVHRYNYLQVHSTTQEIPIRRFEQALQGHQSLFRPFALPKPYTLAKDVFCLHYKRIADGYRRISIAGQSFQIAHIEPRAEVELHLIPDEPKNQVEMRCWAAGKCVQSIYLPISAVDKAVHF
jgi:transposase